LRETGEAGPKIQGLMPTHSGEDTSYGPYPFLLTQNTVFLG